MADHPPGTIERALRVAVLICRAVERIKLLTTKRPVELIQRSTASASLRIALRGLSKAVLVGAPGEFVDKRRW